MVTITHRVNSDAAIAGLAFDRQGYQAAQGELPVLATPSALGAAAAWAAANKGALAGAGAFAGLFGAGYAVGVANAGD